MGKKVFGETGMRALLNGLKTQFDTKADLVDGKLAAAQMPPVSFNDLTDNPLGTQAIAGFDLAVPDNVQDLDSIDIGDGMFVYRVSSPITREELCGSTLVAELYESNILTGTETMVITDDDIEDVGDVIIAADASVVSVLKDGAEWADVGATNLVSGLYLLKIVDDSITMCASLWRPSGVIQGKLSYHDLTDTPCSLRTIAGYSFSLPQDIDSVDHISVEKDMEIDHDTRHVVLRYCRVGDMLTLDQLTGCTANMESSATDGDSGTETQAVNPDADNFVVQATHISMYDGLLLSVFSDNTDIDGATFNSGTYLSSAVMYDSNGTALMTNTLRTIRKDDTVDVHQIDKDLVPDLSELNGTISPTQLPELSEINGSVTADQVPSLNDLNGTLDSSKIQGTLTTQWSEILNKPSGVKVLITPNDVDWSVSRTVPGQNAGTTFFRVRTTMSTEQLQLWYRITHSPTVSEELHFSPTASVYIYASTLVRNTYIESGNAPVVTFAEPTEGSVAILWFETDGVYHGTNFPAGLWVREDWCFNFWLTTTAETFSNDDYQKMYSPTWDDVASKPFGEIKRTELFHITSFDSSDSAVRDENLVYYRVCDYMSPAELEHSVLRIQNGNSSTDRKTILLSSQYERTGYPGYTYWAIDGTIYLMSTPESIGLGGGNNFPSSGVWVLGWQDAPYVDLVKYSSAEQQLDRKYLPSSAILPSVASSDNGKILRVVDGVWTAVSLPSASGVSF